MRVLAVLAIVAFLAISLVTSFPSNDSDINQGSAENQSVINPVPRWPRWGGIGPVVLNTPPTKNVT
ncbi:uncharacterized protein LOC108087528 [Drosophila ficusphila]|uniref:uncharacterized protein LOC108087528 n=1 Tax=Drosophila ficusphila TaxID=30025 RepID=UPI0007E5E07E|nr:uncharacterized protein LOC108087528 [Drosophila ficusphila]